MKRIKSIIFVLLVGLLICICNDKETAEMKITCSEWDEQSNWDPNYKRPESKKNYTVSTGDVIDLKGVSDLSVRIVSISDDKIVIRTNTFMSDSADGIDLGSTKTKFVIYKGEKVELNTLSMDAGNIYIFELVSVP